MNMQRLTAKEEEIMSFFWDKGPLFVKQIYECYPDPRPHYNTLSTVVRGLEEKGFVGYTAFEWKIGLIVGASGSGTTAPVIG